MIFRVTFIFILCSSFSHAGESLAGERLNDFLKSSNMEYNKLRKEVRNDRLKGVWIDDEFIYEWDEAGKKVYYSNSPQGKKKVAFNQEILARKIAELTKKKVSAKNLRIQELRAGDAGLELKISKYWYRWQGQELSKVKRVKRGNDRVLSPDGKWRTHVVGAKLFIEEVGKEREMLMDGDSEKQTFRDVNWAPDSKKFVVSKVTKGQGRKVQIIESSPKDQLQPKLHEFNYDKPGDVISVSQPWVFFIDAREPFPADESLLVNPYQVNRYQWRDDHTFTYHFIERGFGKHHVIHADTKTRKHRVLIREDSDTYVYAFNGYRYDMPGGKEMIWKSERDGWNHLYLYDGITGEVINQITKGEMTVHEVIHVDEKKRRILFTAGGEVKGRDPYYKHWYWVNFDGTDLTRITQGNDNHILKFSADYGYAMDTVCGMDRAASYQIIDGTTGKVLSVIGKCDLSEIKAMGWQMPESFVTTDRDGKFDIWGTIHRPANFESNKKYPVIEFIYAGPHDQHVSKKLRFWSAGIQELTMRGFIVVQIDGKGTNKRCKEFSHFCYKNIVDAGFPDRIKWIKQAAKKHPQMDIARVGIFGGSAGGQNSAGAVLHHGDFYKAAFSDCGCHDNRMDKLWWNEQWMDWPVGPHYAEQSNVTNAAKLTGKLFLCVGELDRNVDPASTMQLANALVKAGKDFDLLVMPGSGHGCADSGYGRWRRAKFFTEHLGEPVSKGNQ